MAVLVTRPHPDDEATAGLLRASGFEVLQAPMLRFEPVPFHDDADERYGAIIVTSANALRAIAPHLGNSRLLNLPLFAVKSIYGACSLLFQLCFFVTKMVQKLLRNRIICAAELLCPLHNDVAVAQGPKGIKKRRGLPPHPLPIFVRINGAEPVRHRPATAKSNAQIMDWFIFKAVGSHVGFPWYLIHPVNQARVFADWTLGSHSKAL